MATDLFFSCKMFMQSSSFAEVPSQLARAADAYPYTWESHLLGTKHAPTCTFIDTSCFNYTLLFSSERHGV